MVGCCLVGRSVGRSVGRLVAWLARCLGMLVSKRGCVVQQLCTSQARIQIYVYTYIYIHIIGASVCKWRSRPRLSCHYPYFRAWPPPLPTLPLSLFLSLLPMHRGPLYSIGARPYIHRCGFCVVEATAVVVAGGMRRAMRRYHRMRDRWNKYSGRRWKRAHKACVYELPDSEAAGVLRSFWCASRSPIFPQF